MRSARLSPKWVILGSLSIVLVVGLLAVMILVQRGQDTRQQASISQGPVQVQFFPNNVSANPGQAISVDVQVNTGGRLVDGVQLVYSMSGNYPTAQAVSFTPVTGGLLESANQNITSSEGGIWLQLGLVTKNPAQPFSSTTFVKVGTLNFVAPPSGGFTLTPEPTAQRSKAIEHNTLQDILRSVFTAQFQLSVISPTPSTRPARPISWQTSYGQLSASDFSITIGNQTFLAVPDGDLAVTLHSNPGSGTNPTLEATWVEKGIEMRVFIYFAKQNNNWIVSEIRTYNGQNPGNWLYYSGTAIGTHAIGSIATFPTLSLTSDNQSAIKGTLLLQNVSLQPQLAATTPIPSPSIISSPTPVPSPSIIVTPTPAVTPSPSGQPSPTACAATADINKDTRINISDYAELLRAYVSGRIDTGADLNCDGRINLVDYSVLLQAYRGGST